MLVGAALSIWTVTGKPIKFIGTGEKIDALEPFHPERIASRILGMGDILSLIERAEEAISVEKAKEIERKLREESFTLADFKQLQQVRRWARLIKSYRPYRDRGSRIFKLMARFVGLK
jgi:signal recognition particle subunit SRP54